MRMLEQKAHGLGIFVMLAMVAGMLVGTAQAQMTTFTGTAGRYDNDTWNQLSGGVPQYWDNGIPSGDGPWEAVISTGSIVYATAGYLSAGETPTPAYTGNLILQSGAVLEIAQNSTDADLNAFGTGTITMQSNSKISMRRKANTVHAQNFILEGNATYDMCLSTSAHHNSRTFNGTISGAGRLTVTGVNNNTGIFNANNASWAGGLVATTGASRIEARVAGALGTGDVTINAGMSLRISAEGAISPGSTLYLNGTKGSGTAKLDLYQNNQVFALYIDGLKQDDGVYDSGEAWLDGTGKLTVKGPPAGTVLIVR